MQVTSDWNQRYSETDLQKTKRRSGTHGELGIRYEKELLLLVLLRAIDMKIDFTLDTNVEGCGAFDDVVFTYKEGNGIVQRIYLQAKHKEDKNKKITYEDFLKSGKSSNNDYALYKYFIDYLKIIEKYDDESRKINQYFIIYTNIDFRRTGPDVEGLRIYKKSETDYFMFKEIDFSNHKWLRIFSCIDYTATKSTSFYQFLERNIANVVNERDRVVKVLMKRFKEIDKEKKIGKLSERELSSKLNEYLNLLFFAVDQPDEKKLGDVIKEEISVNNTTHCLRQDEINMIFTYALSEISVWKDLKSAKPLTERDDYFTQGKEKLNSLKELNVVLLYENEFSDTNVEFVEELYREVNDFILSGKQIWDISSETPWLSSLVIYQALKEETLSQKTKVNYASHDHHLLLPWSYLFEKSGFILSTFNDMGQSLLIIVCESRELVNPMLSEITNKIIQIVCASENNLKQVIVIGTENNQLSKELSKKEKVISFYTKQPKKINFCDLVGASQEACLAKKVHFQGRVEPFTIKQLLGLDESFRISENSLANFNLDALGLERILRSSTLEIGNQKLYLSELESMHYRTQTHMKNDQIEQALLTNAVDTFAFVGKECEVKALLPRNRQQDLILFENRMLTSNFILLKVDYEFMQLCHEIKQISIERGTINDAALPQFHLLEKINGKWVWTRTYNPNIYMKRLLYPVVVDEKKLGSHLLNKSPSSDFVVFSGISEETLLDSLCTNQESKENILKTTFIFEEESDAEVEFERLRNDYNLQIQSIHWLKVKTDGYQKEFQWYRSEGEINRLRSVLKQDQVDRINRKPFEENMLLKSKARVIVIADDPGMGKSTTLVHMAELMKKEMPILWVIKVDLNRYQTVLDFSPVNTLESFMISLSKIDSKLADHLSCSILTYKLTCPEHVLFIFDGFDEVVLKKQEAVVALFKILRNETAARVFITTRRHNQRYLEQHLSVFAYPFQPLKQENQIDYLTRFWAMTLKLTCKKEDLLALESYARKLIQHFGLSIHDYKASFISIPLQTRMFAEVYQDGVGQAIQNKLSVESFIAENQLDMLNLYQIFIDRKYRIFLQEKKDSKLDDESTRYLMWGYCKNYGLLAVKELFNKCETENFINDRRDREEEIDLNTLSCIGLIQGNEEPIYFIHRTFAEYFAAKWLFKHAENLEVQTFLCIQLFKKEFGVVRRFIDYFSAENLLLHKSVLKGDSSIFNELPTNLDIDERDILGRSALYLAAQEGRSRIIQPLMSLRWSRKTVLDDDTFIRDRLHKTPLHYASAFNHDEVIDKLLKELIDIDLDGHIFSKPLHFDADVDHSIFSNMERERSALLKLVNEQDLAGKNALYYAVQNEHWKTACHLMIYGANFRALSVEDKRKLLLFSSTRTRDTYSNNTLSFRLIIGSYSAEVSEAAKKVSDDAESPLLSHFLKNGHPVVGLLSMEVPEAVYEFTDDYEYPRLLSYFFERGHTKVIDKVLKSIENEERRLKIANAPDNLRSPMSRVWKVSDNCEKYFSDKDYLKIIRYFHEQGRELGVKFEKQDVDNFLLKAALLGFLEAFKYLCENKMKTEGESKVNFVKKNQMNITYLFSNIQDLNLDDRWLNELKSICHEVFGWTQLHLAAMNKNVSSIEDYLNPPVYENINMKDTSDMTPLLIAAGIKGRSSFIHSLFEALKTRNINDKGKLYDIVLVKNKRNGCTPLHWVIINGDIDSAEVLLKNILNIGFSQEQCFDIINSREFGSFRNPIGCILECEERNTQFIEILFQYIKLFNFSSQEWMRILFEGSKCLLHLLITDNPEASLILLAFIKNLPLDADHRVKILGELNTHDTSAR